MDRLRKLTLKPANVRETVHHKAAALGQGRSLMDWIKFSKELAQKGQAEGDVCRYITTEELASHNTLKDLWISLCGNVYNVTPYVYFHPGGADQLMLAAGKDGTELFERVHPWVNFRSMLSSCHMGKLSVVPANMGLLRQQSLTSVSMSESSEKDTASRAKPQSQPSLSNRGLFIDRQARSEHNITLTAQNRKGEAITASDVVIHFDLPRRIVFVLYETGKECMVHQFGLRSVLRRQKLQVEVKETDEGYWMVDLVGPEHELLGITNVTRFPFRAMSAFAQGLFWPISLQSREKITSTASLYTFRVPPNLHICPRIGSYMLMRLDRKDDHECRAYTPIASIAFRPRPKRFVAELNYIIKNVPNGHMTSHLQQMEIGDVMLVSPCIDQCPPEDFNGQRHMVLIAAGSGITPFVDLITFATKNKSLVRLIYCNQCETDIIYRNEIDRLAANEKWFDVVHVVTSPSSPDWNGERGPISMYIVRTYIPCRQNVFIGVCGPPDFLITVSRLLEAANVDMGGYHKFG